jgi:carbamoyl-phosphate synthase small subunit
MIIEKLSSFLKYARIWQINKILLLLLNVSHFFSQFEKLRKVYRFICAGAFPSKKSEKDKNLMVNFYNWKERREKKALLVLEDGTVFRGYSFGAEIDIEGEVVFNTGMSGYQEIITDPSYAGQFVTMTYPELGNTGINSEDSESRELFLSGLIVNGINEASSWRNEISLKDFLKKNNVPGIAGIDTRALTTLLRNKGTMKAFMHCSDLVLSPKECLQRAQSWEGLDNQDYAVKVTCSDIYKWDSDKNRTLSWGLADDLSPADLNIVAYDFGIKWNILRCFRLRGMNVTVVPAQTSAEEVMKLSPDGVFFSNGPADPAAVSYAIKGAKKLIGKVPVMGICLGHQLLSLACGAKTYRLKFGHHGCNHPVKNLISGKIEITSQNHNFAVDTQSLSSTLLEISHINLNDNTVEGVKHKTEPMFAVQYHPEASPGPHDPGYLFDTFRELIIKS